MPTWTFPSVADFKAFFTRDFSYAPANDASNDDFVMDADITKAITEAKIHFNQALGFGSDDGLTVAALHLTAFFLVQTLQLSAKGVGAAAKFPINSQSVGGVSLGYEIPEAYKQDPFINQLAQNGYGVKFFMLASPFLRGRVLVAEGTTTPW